MKRRVKITAVFLLVFYIVALAFSFNFTAKNRNHDCVGEDCPVCAVLRIAEEISDEAKKLASAAISFIVVFSVVLILFDNRKREFKIDTPVSLHDLQLN